MVVVVVYNYIMNWVGNGKLIKGLIVDASGALNCMLSSEITVNKF